MSAAYIRVFEHQSLTVGDEVPHALTRQPVTFTDAHLQALEAHFGKKGVPYYSMIRRGVRFCEMVGVLQVGNLTIEVLPKTERHATEADAGKWHQFLIHMLRTVGTLKVAHTGYAHLRLRSHSILDLYMELFLSELQWLLHTGLVKRYRKVEGNSYALKGSLQFAPNIRHNLTHAERFYVRYTTYDKDHIWNALLQQTTKLIARISRHPSIVSQAQSLLLDLPNCQPVSISDATFERLTYSRKTEGYRKAMQLARLLLLNYHPDVCHGQQDVLALMFDMNTLWERYVCKKLRQALEQHAAGTYEVKAQESTPFWKPQDGHARTIQPDMVVCKDGTPIVVLDTKWKHLIDLRPADADLKQMFAYNLYNIHTAPPRSALVYPTNQTAKGIQGHYQQKDHGSCSLLLVPLVEDAQDGKKLDLSGVVGFITAP